MRRVFLVGLILLTASSTALARTWYITPDGTGDAPTIQAGVDSAVTGDLILLADGIFTGEGNRDIFCSGKEITVMSGSDDPEACVINCEGTESANHRGFHFECGGCHSHLEGLKIINGYANYGGGIFDHSGASSLTIVNCCFSGNHSSADGGAIEGMLLNVSGCVFSDNSATWYGGAVCANRETSISDCLFERNAACEGGALLVQNNGMEVTKTVISGCLFIGNTADLNGGVVVAGHEWTNFRMEDCVLAENAAAPSGGVVGLGSWCGKIYGFRMDRCTVAGNEAGIEEISRPPGPYLYRTIIACNSRGAGGCAEVFCCDIYGNQEGDWVGCIAGQYGVNGNFSACPSFCSMDAWDFRLCNESPCLPGNHPDGYDCGLIGALGEGCACGPTETEPTTWSGIKAVYR